MNGMSSSATNFKVIYVGAGEVIFGSPEGPWSHSLRLEKALGTSLSILGIIDPDVTKSRAQVSGKITAGVPGYESCQHWAAPEDAAQALGGSEEAAVDLIIVACPPHFRGGITSATSMDLRLLKAFPLCKRWLVEKPVSAAAPRPEAGLEQVLDAYKNSGAIVGVGYMLRALKAVKMMHSIIKEKGLVVMGTQARYYMTYDYEPKLSWWNTAISCGPIVEQATHLASLSIAFGGAVDLSSIRAHTLLHHEGPGKLSKLGFDEAAVVPPEDRVPRYTSAIWKYESGAMGSLIHIIALQSTPYDTEFEVIADGHVFKLSEVYTSTPRLEIRSPGSATVETITFEGDDPFQTQMDAMIANSPKCTYAEALATYELTWAIRQAGELEQAKRKPAR